MSTEIAAFIANYQAASVDGTFEEAMSALESIVALMDSGDLTLDQSLDCFEIGARLSARCQQLLEQAELRIELIQQSLNATSDSEPPF